MIDLYASSTHYAEHLWPIWQQLKQRGLAERSYGSRSFQWWSEARGPRPAQQRGTQPVLVASLADYQHTAPAPVVYVEHGAGQTYDGDSSSRAHGSYSGGAGLDRVVLFICPHETVAARWAERYSARCAVVGCPKLDAWHDRAAPVERDGRCASSRGNTVAVTFHWDCPLVPETRSAWMHYDRALAQLARWARESDVELLGHGHPRIWRSLSARWLGLEVEPVASFDDVLARAGLLVADNTSALFEFASLDRPVLVLNAPWYRRDVEHGGRFWRWADVGRQIDGPADLVDGVTIALLDDESVQQNRRRVVSEVYSATDGHAAERAADAISEVLHHAYDVRGTERRSTAPRGF